MKGLTLTIVTPKIQSINYGETIGNVSTIKKLSTGTNNPKKLITYFSDKAIKYDVKRIGREQFGWNLMDQSVVQVFVRNHSNGNFNYDNFLKDMVASYHEFDLFGGMFADIGNVSNEIKNTVHSDQDIESFISELSDDIEINVSNKAIKVKKIRESLKIILESSGKNIEIDGDTVSIDELRTDASKLKEIKSKIEGIGRRRIAIKIDGENKNKRYVQEILEAIEIVYELLNKEISYKKHFSIEDTNKLKRSQPVRFSNGYSISEFVYDMNLLNDIDAYNRYIQYTAGQKKQSLVYPEEHYSYYTYTLTIDLDRVGAVEVEKDGKVDFEPVVDPSIRAKRVSDVLNIVLFYLNRQIKGRNERLTPVFVIGGVYDVKHPFFANAINFWEDNQKLFLKSADITKILDMYSSQNIAANTLLYFDDSFVSVNGGSLPLSNKPIKTIYDSMKKAISNYYSGVYNEYTEQLIKELEQKDKDITDFQKRLEEIKTEENNLENEIKNINEKMKGLIEKRAKLIEDIKKN